MSRDTVWLGFKGASKIRGLRCSGGSLRGLTIRALSKRWRERRQVNLSA